MRPPVQSPTPFRAIDTDAQGEKLIAEISHLLDELVVVIDKETALVRAGRVVQAAELGVRKTELAGRYYAATERLKANAGFFAAKLPDKVGELRQRHELCRPLLQTNLTVLATAHAVSEGIIRGVAGELTRKAAPQTYGMSGRPSAPPPNAARPVTLSRTL